MICVLDTKACCTALLSASLCWLCFICGCGYMDEVFAINVYDECEIHENCTVEIWKNSTTGEISIGWYENGNTETE